MSESAIQPNNDKLIENLTTTGQMIGRLLLTLFSLGVFALLILGFPDSNLLPTKETIALPFAGPTSFKTLLFGLPIVMIGVRIYLEIYLRHWEELESERIDLGIDEPRIVSPLRQPVLKVFTWIILYPLVPVAIALLAYKAAVFYWLAVALSATSMTSVSFLLLGTGYPRDTWIPCIALLGGVFFIAAFPANLENVFHRPFQLQLANLERAVLADVDFRDADLINANLKNADLQDADFRNATLHYADLQDADLRDADLQGADLYDANLQDAELRDADLQGAVLVRANLQDAFLMRANLQGAELLAANLQDARLLQANLQDAYLLNARALIQDQLNEACGDGKTKLPDGLTIPLCSEVDWYESESAN